MQIADLEMLLDVINKGSKLPAALQDNPVDQLKFDLGTNMETLLNQSELATYNQLESQMEEVVQALKNNGQPQLEELFFSYDEISSNLNALAMNATFREGLLKGFRLALFFLQGAYRQDNTRND